MHTRLVQHPLLRVKIDLSWVTVPPNTQIFFLLQMQMQDGRQLSLALMYTHDIIGVQTNVLKVLGFHISMSKA